MSAPITSPPSAPPIPEKVWRAPAEQATLLLSLFLLASLVLAGYAFVRLESSHDAAAAAQRDLVVCRADLADLAAWSSTRTTGAPLTDKDPELNRRLSAAARAAGIPSELASIEPSQPSRVKDTDYTETSVFVRLGAVTLKELAAFLKDLSASDTAVKTKTIELSIPAEPSQRPGELWTSDVALVYLTYAPRGREGR